MNLPPPAGVINRAPVPVSLARRARWGRRLAAVGWASFLVAAVLEMAVFAFVDPTALHTLAGSRLALSDTAIYSLAFVVFWGGAAAAALLTLLLDGSAEEINAVPVVGDGPR